jgi:uncharacterized phage protein (TIGR02218 family)
MDITIFSTGEDFPYGGADDPLPTGQNLKKLVHDGLFDGAYIQLDRAYMPEFGDTSLGLVTLFGGRVGRVEITALGVSITVVSSNVLMAQNMPRNTFQLGCIHTLYDSGCTLNRASFTAEFTVDAAGATTVNMTAGIGGDGSQYMLGTLIVLDGLGAGQRRQIDRFGPIGVGLAYPLLQVPVPGDHVTLTQGCDKTKARCTVLGNLDNYRGFPNIPPASSGI